LKKKRNRSDLIEVFKMAKNLSPIPLNKFFELNTDNRTRGHSFKLVEHRCNCEVRRHFFSERVVNRWNMLDQATICKDCEWFQVKIRIGTKKKDGPVSGLKSAGPHRRFQSFGVAGPVSYLWDRSLVIALFDRAYRTFCHSSTVIISLSTVSEISRFLWNKSLKGHSRSSAIAPIIRSTGLSINRKSRLHLFLDRHSYSCNHALYQIY